MRSKWLPLFAGLALVGCDQDYDGFSGSADCDDADPYVYPGAPDAPGDGIDADCDGEDPQHPLVGDWAIAELDVAYSSFRIFEPGSAEGELGVDKDLDVELAFVGTLDPALYGQPVQLEFALEGWSSPDGGEDSFAVYLEGEGYGESVTLDWTCVVFEETELDCLGTLKALEIGLEAEAVFELE